MKLVIEGNSKIKGPFIRWLTARLKGMLILNLDTKQVYKLQNYFNENFPDYKLNLLTILMNSFNLIRYRKIGKIYIIYIDTHRRKCNDIALIDILKFINNGNLEIEGCRVFTKTFLEVEKNINDLYTIYERKDGSI